MSTADPDWFEGFFDEDYLRFAVDRYPAEATAAEVDFLISALALEPGTRVLDLACGHGRHSVELARHGCAVTGVDLSEPSLALAAARAAEAGVDVGWSAPTCAGSRSTRSSTSSSTCSRRSGTSSDDAENRLVIERVVRCARARRRVPARDDQPGRGVPALRGARLAPALGRHGHAGGAVLRHGAGPVRDLLDVHERRRAPRASLLAPRLHRAGADRDRRPARGSRSSGCGAGSTAPTSTMGSRRIVMLARRRS